jgi:hypothetical protein
MEGKEVDREVSPPILKREREEELPESVAAIPSPVETSSGFDPAFSLAPFLSKRYIGRAWER